MFLMGLICLTKTGRVGKGKTAAIQRQLLCRQCIHMAPSGDLTLYGLNLSMSPPNMSSSISDLYSITTSTRVVNCWSRSTRRRHDQRRNERGIIKRGHVTSEILSRLRELGFNAINYKDGYDPVKNRKVRIAILNRQG